SGRVCKALEENRPDDARSDLDRLAQVFGRDSTYVEMQNAGLDIQQRINPALAKLAGEAGLPLVATGDVHYLRHEDARAHEALLCIQSGDSLRTRTTGSSTPTSSSSSRRPRWRSTSRVTRRPCGARSRSP